MGDGCDHWTSAGGVCGDEPTRAYLPGRRCARHSPAALAGRPETVPDPARTLAGLRAAAGINPQLTASHGLSGLTDVTAVASGKRRAAHHEFQAARAQLDANRQTRARLAAAVEKAKGGPESTNEPRSTRSQRGPGEGQEAFL